MSSTWSGYSIFYGAAIFALSIPLGLHALSRLLSRDQSIQSPKISQSPPLSPSSLGQRINPRFFFAVNSALILIMMTVALIPCVTSTLSPDKTGLLLIAGIATLAGLGLLYSVKKGDLSWLRSYPTSNKETKK